MSWIVALGISTAALWLWLNRRWVRYENARERREMQHHVWREYGGRGKL